MQGRWKTSTNDVSLGNKIYLHNKIFTTIKKPIQVKLG
jgi:hypothetical protein